MPFPMANGIISGMEVRIDKAGRIVVPKALRDRLGLKPDSDLEVVEQSDGVLLRKPHQVPSMVRIDGLWVHQGVPEPSADWNRVVDDVREERIEAILKV